MPLWSKKDREWKDQIRAAMVAAGKMDEFVETKRSLYEELIKHKRDKKACDKLAWKQASADARFAPLFDIAKFELEWKDKNAVAVQKRRDHMVKIRQLKKKKAEPEEHNVPMTPTVNIKDGDNSSADILRDIRWVYLNMSRLFVNDTKNKCQKLSVKVLREAPSNGAVGIAHYALADKKAFFEKFVTRILPKDDESKKGPSPDELKSELDPTFDELERYMAKMSPVESVAPPIEKEEENDKTEHA